MFKKSVFVKRHAIQKNNNNYDRKKIKFVLGKLKRMRFSSLK